MDVRTRKFAKRLSSQLSVDEILGYFANPVFIVSAPRSGSTLLFSLLVNSPDIWTIRAESHGVYSQFPHLSGENDQLDSGRLGAAHADEATCERMRLLYLALLKDRDDRSLYDALQQDRKRKIVFLEKTPRNALNINFLMTVFPDAHFIYLYRDPRENISSLIEGWERGAKTGQFVTFRNLPDWPIGYWCFLLPPNWQAKKNKSLAEIAAFQWQACNEIIMDDLAALDTNQWSAVSYHDLINNPQAQLNKLCQFCHAKTGEYLDTRAAGNLPLSASTVTPPLKDKWKRHEHEIMNQMPNLQQTVDRIAAFK